MTKAPETIWVGPSRDDKGEFWDVGHWDSEPDPNCVPYVPRDLHLAEVSEARVEALRDAADMLENGNGIGGQLSAKRVRAMIEKEQTDE